VRGYTLVELLVALSLGAIVMLGLARVMRTGFASEAQRSERDALAMSAQFAMDRMTHATRGTPRLLLPLADDPRTGAVNEAVREQSTPPRSGHASETAVLAVALDPTADRNGNGIPDADNDGDGRFDEDHHTDSTDDGATGIVGIDDDNDGIVDEILLYVGDDDEDGAIGEDPVNGIDDDGDGSIDEDPPADMNNDARPGIAGVDDDGDGVADEGGYTDDDEDGRVSEDGYDPVVFHLAGSTLMERVPVPWDVNKDGSVNAGDWMEEALAEGVSYFRVERIHGSRADLVDLTLEITTPTGASVRLATRQRVGGGT
jgi:prepilin-type N-terminal cleavage/methylation domain-containing protein